MSESATIAALLKAAVMVVVAMTAVSLVMAPALGGMFALDADMDGDYQYTGYEVEAEGGSEYVSNVSSYGQRSMRVEFTDYNGAVPDQIILYQDGSEVTTEQLFEVDDSAVVSLDGADSGEAEIVVVSVSGGGFAGSEEVTVLDRHTVSIETEQKTAKCSWTVVCPRFVK